MKCFLHSALFLMMIISINVHAQNLGNEWINYDQEYYRVPVTEDGIHRIPYQILVNRGFPANEIDPRRIQLFYEGEEQYIYIKGEGSNGIFDPSGYIEFYGQRNRGYRDTVLWDNPENCINPDYSLFTDTAIYYLTYNTSINNRRIANITADNFDDFSGNLASYCIKHVRQNYTGTYYGASTQCVYTEGESYLDASRIQDGSPRTKVISTGAASSLGPDAVIETAVSGTPNEDFASSIPHHLKVDFLGATRVDEIYYGYEFVRNQVEIPASQIPNQIGFVFSSNDVQSSSMNDYNRLAYIDIKYAHSFDFEGTDQFAFYLPPGSGAKDYLEITNFNGGSSVFLFDIDQHERILAVNEDNMYKVLANNNGETRHMVLTNQDGLIFVDSLAAVSQNAKFTDYLTENPISKYLIITHPKLMSAAQEYQAYRNSTGYDAVIFNIEELYDQYAYGVKKHPYAMRNLVQDIINQTARQPDFLFLLGKGIRTATARNNAGYFSNNLVPSFGDPPSDVLITAGMGDTEFEPLIPTGRLAAKTNQEVLDYLDKVRVYESNPVDEWMKQIIHFGGGANENEQQTFASYLEDYEEIIEDTLFGGFVHTFLKNSSAPIQISTSDSVRNLINTGTSMMCFFGHGSTSGFDQNIDFPENYSNQDRYPFMLANSCLAGNIHLQYSESSSEDWVLIPNRGAIGFLASVGLGLPSYLNVFTRNLYRQIAYENYGTPISYQQQQGIKKAQQGSLSDIRLKATCHEMTLHADPAIRINFAELPDLKITNGDLRFSPEEISTVQDSFQVFVAVRNVGRAFQDNFLIHVERRFPDNSTESLDIIRAGSLYLDTIMFKLPVNNEKGPGLNQLIIRLDYYDEIEELSEMNNNLTLNFLISSSNLFPIYPYEYAIYPDASVTLKASTGMPFASEMQYLFQIDTTDLFNSNLGAPLYSGDVTSHGGVVEWSVPASLTNNQVYYWRVAAAHANPDSIRWNESSFIYILGEEGWSQAHFFQFKKDEFNFVNYNRDTRDFSFVETTQELHVHNQGILWEETFNDVFWSIDGASGSGFGDLGSCGNAPAMIVAVIDPVEIRGWASDYQDFGHVNYPKCFSQGAPGSFFVFRTGSADDFNEEAMLAMNDMLVNHVPDGHYIVAYSWADGYFESWSETLLSTFESLGSTQIRSIPNDMPYLFFCQKGDPDSAEERVGDSPTDEIDFYTNLTRPFNYGTIISTVIGPSNYWSSLHWYQESTDDPNYDINQLEILKFDPVTFEETPIDTVYPPNYDIYQLNNEIPASENPFLKLRFRTRDDTVKTPGQLDKWQIRYTGIPETAINPQAGFYHTGDTILQGEDYEFALATENISPYDMDSLLVKYWVQGSNNEIIELGTKRLRPHPAGDVILDTIRFNTIDLIGLNSVWVEYNPTVAGGDYDQPEQYHFNNIAQYFFYVQSDNENPILDVTFDGVRILDGDIVSAKPEILISLNDENPYLALNDTALFRVYLMDITRGTERRIFFRDSMGNEQLEWTPGVLPENKFRIVYRPEFEDDGVYQLRVQATDMSGNDSGEFDFAISFEVITKSSITHILNYPNPFSTSTRFVFELTGSVIPDEIRIEIYTVTGKLVKVIDQYELGPVNIGRNISEYAWDGTDMYGDRLGNGVYFYRVKTKIHGDDIEHRSNESDVFFKQEIGKMYLMR
jgi:hypothetical protein